MKSETRKKVLIGISEFYTRQKIIDCFKFRTDYEVYEFDCESKHDPTFKSDIDFFDMFWLEYEDLDFEKLIKCEKKLLFNSYCIRKGLIRKAQLAYYLKKYIAKKPNSQLVKYLPETYVFELDYLDYLDEALNECYEVEASLNENEKIKSSMEENKKTKKFILKSSMTNKGAEMLIFDSRVQLENFFKKRIEQSEDESIDLREWVIQEYIQNPLQLNAYNKRKFHIRVYVLAVGSLKVYVYDDMLALFSLSSYENQNKIEDNEKLDMKSHITNTCVQLADLNLGSDGTKKAEYDAVKRFWSLNFDESNEEKNLQKKNIIFDQIKNCVSELFKCFLCEPTVFQPLPNAFEIYGLDFLVDENYNCLFLEANAFPDFKQTGDNLNDLIDCLFYQTISIASDSYFNIPSVCDVNKLTLVLEEKRKF
jgi:tubulin---tyrosine ligase